MDVMERYPLVAQPLRNARFVTATSPTSSGPGGPHTGAVRVVLVKYHGLGGQAIEVRADGSGRAAVATAS